MFKNVISPIQAWLLSQGRCVACGTPLSQGKSKKRKDGTSLVACKCGRMYVYNPAKKTYRRALLSEV